MWSDYQQRVRRKDPDWRHLGDSEGETGPENHVYRDRESHGEEEIDPEKDQNSFREPLTRIIRPILDYSDTNRTEGY